MMIKRRMIKYNLRLHQKKLQWFYERDTIPRADMAQYGLATFAVAGLFVFSRREIADIIRENGPLG
ncbi:hypothetical protein [Thermosediminibacter litoriperuensis]|nr:hypothetical protein [Thermosediminibacter litoriperuensis]